MSIASGTKLLDADFARLARKIFIWAQAQRSKKQINKFDGVAVVAKPANKLPVTNGDAVEGDNDD